jgi:hypothetical protein
MTLRIVVCPNFTDALSDQEEELEPPGESNMLRQIGITTASAWIDQHIAETCANIVAIIFCR